MEEPTPFNMFTKFSDFNDVHEVNSFHETSQVELMTLYNLDSSFVVFLYQHVVSKEQLSEYSMFYKQLFSQLVENFEKNKQLIQLTSKC